MWNSCLQIDRADFFFAWIDDLTCYGTLAEIGYARAKYVFVAIGGPTLFDDLWFAYQMADLTLIRKNPTVAFLDALSLAKPKL
jgi:hypothetical protein